MVNFTPRNRRMRPADRDGVSESERPGPCCRSDVGDRRPHLGPTAAWSRGASDLDLSDLEDRSKDDLYEIAKRLKIEGRCRMSREQLVEAIRAVA